MSFINSIPTPTKSILMVIFIMGIMMMSIPVWLYAFFEHQIPLPISLSSTEDTYGMMGKIMMVSFGCFAAGILLSGYSGILLFRGIASDAEKKRSARLIQESEEKYRLLFSTENDAILLFDRQTLALVEINQAAINLYGYSRHESKSVKLHDLLEYSKKSSGNLTAIEQLQGEQIHLTQSGKPIPVDVSAAEFTANQREYLCLIIRDITQRRQLEETIMNISNEERQRIGHDLHDGLGQELTAAALTVKALENRLRQKSLPEADDLKNIVSQLNQTISSTRAIARGLAPVSLEKNGLPAALKDLFSSLEMQSGIRFSFHWQESLNIHSLSSETHLYRIIQEAVNNAIKHSGTKEIIVSLEEEDHHRVILRVMDKGKGMSQHPASYSLGMKTLQYRAAILGGRIEIISGEKSGTTVICRFVNTPRKEIV